MPEPDPYVVCDLTVEHYDEVVALWQRAGLHIRPEGRDSATAFARQSELGFQRVIGVRLRAPTDSVGLLIAVAVLTHDGRKGWINRLAVDPAYRRRGLARHLISDAERWFQQDVGLEVWAALIEGGNGPSRALFAQLGYGDADVVYVSKRTRTSA